MVAAAGGALVVVDALVGAVLAVDVSVMDVVDVIPVHDRIVAAAGAVGVSVLLGGAVLERQGHGTTPCAERRVCQRRTAVAEEPRFIACQAGFITRSAERAERDAERFAPLQGSDTPPDLSRLVVSGGECAR